METMASQIRETRNPLPCRLQYTSGGARGSARLLNVSRSGASMQLGRYLRPNREILVTFESPVPGMEAATLRARVVWCRPAGNGLEFTAGLYLCRDTPEAALAFAALGHAARAAANKAADRMVVMDTARRRAPRLQETQAFGLAQAQAV